MSRVRSVLAIRLGGVAESKLCEALSAWKTKPETTNVNFTISALSEIFNPSFDNGKLFESSDEQPSTMASKDSFAFPMAREQDLKTKRSS
jgi:hypothetical protein